MNEEALKDAYETFTSGGYTGSIEEFSELLSTNPDALNDAHSTFTEGGYTGDIDAFSELLGLKKKDSSDSSVGDLQKAKWKSHLLSYSETQLKTTG